MTADQLARLVDHTLLRADATPDDIRQHARQAHALGCAAVCVNSRWVEVATLALGEVGSATQVCATVGFPLGAQPSAVKAAEAAAAVGAGAMEIDMVLSLGDAHAGQWDDVCSDIAQVRLACAGAALKVIIESAALDEEGIREACERAVIAGADWVKTSTGLHPAGGASVEAVRVMHEQLAGRAQIKASGGIRDLATAQALLDAGAERLGMSATAEILAECSR